MADLALPENKSALRRLAARGVSAGRSLARRRADQKEMRNEAIGAFVGLPLLRDLSAKLPMLGSLGLDEKLRTAAVAYGLSAFTRGFVSEAAMGACIGAIGAYAWDSGGLGSLSGLFGGEGG